mmetsp:Transcript_30486/g.72590  ORF Transcript_30486/g.72590 Transcript_30486/m.72590 type:complete len:303 (+) Transcript_30486:1695-2603(+)
MLDPEELHRLVNRRCDLVLCRAFLRAAGARPLPGRKPQPCAAGDELSAREAWKQLFCLRHVADDLGEPRGDVGSADSDGALHGCPAQVERTAHEHVEQGRLARPAWPHETDHLARDEPPRDPAQDLPPLARNSPLQLALCVEALLHGRHLVLADPLASSHGDQYHEVIKPDVPLIGSGAVSRADLPARRPRSVSCSNEKHTGACPEEHDGDRRDRSVQSSGRSVLHRLLSFPVYTRPAAAIRLAPFIDEALGETAIHSKWLDACPNHLGGARLPAVAVELSARHGVYYWLIRDATVTVAPAD